MICPKCSGEMFIDEWNGWVWACMCGYDGIKATEEEIKELEEESRPQPTKEERYG